MFLQCNLVQQFHVPYDVGINIEDFPVSHSSYNVIRWFVAGSLPLDFECKKELSPSKVPQLEARTERNTDDVCNDEDGENGAIHA